jgi:CheY-like chemotaxis protein
VALLSAHPDVDLVLMDCHMPEMDGYTATRAIRADGRFAALPVLALTASLFPDDLLACVAAGMNAHIEKPFAVDRLLEVLAHWLTRHRLPAS